MAEVRIYRRAEIDMLNIFEYIKKDSIKNANEVIDRFYNLFEKLEQYPEMGIFPKDDDLINRGYRMLVSDNYLIFYSIVGEIIQVRRILHGVSKYTNYI